MTGKEKKWLTQSPIQPPSWVGQTDVLSSWTDTKDKFVIDIF